MMKEFLLHYFVETSASISSRESHQKDPVEIWRFLFTMPKAEIFLYDSIKEHNGFKLHHGIDIVVNAEANDENQAISNAKNFSESILNLISFATLSSCNPARLLALIDSSDKNSCPSTFYLYSFDHSSPVTSLVQINKDQFEALWKGFDCTQRKDRIMRSLSWLRKGIDSENAVDEFMSYWIAIEALEPILRTKILWDGIKEVCSRKEINNPYNFSDIKDARQKLFHGFHELSDDFVQELKNYIDPLRRAVVFSILLALKIPETSIDICAFVNRKLRRGKIKPYFLQKGKIKNFPKDLGVIISNFPRVKTKINKTELSFTEEGDLLSTIRAEYKYHLPINSTFILQAEESWADPRSGIKKIESQVGEVKKQPQ